MKKKMKKSSGKGVSKHLILTALTGVIFWLIGELAFTFLTEKIWTPLGISVYFLVFAVLMFIILFIILAVKADVSTKEKKRNIKEACTLGIIAMAAVVAFSCLFEFLYELGGRDYYEPTSYIFLVDDSGSMDGTEDLRVQAIKDVMTSDNVDEPYAVYRFAYDAELIKPMGKYDDSDVQLMSFESMGGTEILTSIKTIVKDFSDGKLAGAGVSPKILLVSDGHSSSFGTGSVARLCKKNLISVSTIGIDGCNESFLKKLADSTGGVFVRCEDVSQLAESLEQAKGFNTDRNLLSTRFVYKNDALYAFLRIIFLCMLGVAWSIGKMYFCHDSNKILKKSLLFSIICCVAAVLILEFFAGSFIDIEYLRLIFCVLWAITYGEFGSAKKGSAAKYAETKGMPVPGFVSDAEDEQKKLQSEKEKNDPFKSLVFDGTTKETNPAPDPFSYNPLGNSSAVSGGNSGSSFVQNPLGGQNSSSSQIGNGAGNPFGNNAGNIFTDNSSTNNPFG